MQVSDSLEWDKLRVNRAADYVFPTSARSGINILEGQQFVLQLSKKQPVQRILSLVAG